MSNKYLSFIPLFAVIILAFFFYSKSLIQSSYNGLPAVSCIDQTLPVKENFSFHIAIVINGKTYPIETSIGHDFGQCLHSIYVNDSSGTVMVKSNTVQNYTLGNFFQVWHKTFNQNQIFDFQTSNTHSIRVLVNGSDVQTFENTILHSGNNIEVIYR